MEHPFPLFVVKPKIKNDAKMAECAAAFEKILAYKYTDAVAHYILYGEIPGWLKDASKG